MNGSASSGYGFSGRKPPPALAMKPSAQALAGGLRNGMSNNSEKGRTTATKSRQQRSELVDLNDAIQVHLLAQTALLDSKDFEIVSQDSVDNLKRQIQSLTIRVEQTRANLAVQMKYRDAAISMAKLYSSGNAEAVIKTPLGASRAGGSDAAQNADNERQAGEKRCEELASELSELENRLMDARQRLLQHTAGILRMTHGATPNKKGTGTPLDQYMSNGIPGSPESLYTYSDDRNSLEAPPDEGFGERSLYLPLDQVDGQFPKRRKNTLEVPLKSSAPEQTFQLREETGRLKEEIAQLKDTEKRLRADAGLLQRKSVDQQDSLSSTEERLEALNKRLRQLVIDADPQRHPTLAKPPLKVGDGSRASLWSQLDYLEQGLSIAASEKRTDGTKAADSAVLVQGESQLQALNQQLWTALQASAPNQSPPPAVGRGIDQQLQYLQESLPKAETELRRAADLSASVSSTRQQSQQSEAVLQGLWDIIQTGYAGIKQQKAVRRMTRMQNGQKDDDDDEDDLSGEETINTDEPFSLQAFSAKVQWLYAQATSLKEQRLVLKRQIKQLRELNSQGDSERNVQLQQRGEELEKVQALLGQREKEVKVMQEKLDQALADMRSQQELSSRNESTAVQAAQAQLKERDAKIATLEMDYRNVQNQLSAVESDLAAKQSELGHVSEAKAAAEAALATLERALLEKDAELERLNGMVIELKTELTFAKAELDGAYGSRAERAKEVAALSKASELNQLTTQVQELRAELASTLQELEHMTKETIEAEKEKLQLEANLDDAMNSKVSLEAEMKSLRERLEAEVSRLKEDLDVERLKAPAASGAGGTQRAGASMLSDQFRATMKEERKKFQEELREEQTRRRKLEDELRMLKRTTQGAGTKSLPSPP